MEKNQKILIILIFSILVITTITCGLLIYKNDSQKISDGEKFKNEYESLNKSQYLNSNNKYIDYINVSIPKDNIYIYKSLSQIIDIIKNKTGIIYIGSSENSNCRNIVTILNETAKEKGIESIYYTNIENYRSNYELIDGNTQLFIHGTNEYYELVDLLSVYLEDYVLTDNNNKEYHTGEKILNPSTVIIVKDGKILDFHEGTIDGLISSEKLNDNSKKELKQLYIKMIEKLN